jgi:putative ABC transport system permease protein
MTASLITGVLFGLIPSLQLARPDLSATLKESGGRSGTGFRQNVARSLLVVSEITLAVILLMGAALLIRTFVALRCQSGLRRSRCPDSQNVARRQAL